MDRLDQPIKFGELTSAQLGRIVAEDPILLFPIGSVAQHGPHLPVSADTLAATFIADEVSMATGALVMPAIPYAPSPVFRAFPGTLDIRSESLRAFLEDICKELVRQGFRRFIFVNNSDGSEHAVAEVARLMHVQFGLVSGSLFPWRLGMSLMGDVFADAVDEVGHGAEPETSATSIIRPELVRTDELKEASSGLLEDHTGWRPLSYHLAHIPGQPIGGVVHWGVADVCPSGVLGRVVGPRAERGEVWRRRVVEFCVDYVTEFGRNTRKPGSASGTPTASHCETSPAQRPTTGPILDLAVEAVQARDNR